MQAAIHLTIGDAAGSTTARSHRLKLASKTAFYHGTLSMEPTHMFLVTLNKAHLQRSCEDGDYSISSIGYLNPCLTRDYAVSKLLAPAKTVLLSKVYP